MIPVAAMNSSQVSLYPIAVMALSPTWYFPMNETTGVITDRVAALTLTASANAPRYGLASAIIPGTAVGSAESGEYFSRAATLNLGTGEYAFAFFMSYTGDVPDLVISERFVVTSPFVGPTFAVNQGGSPGKVRISDKEEADYFKYSTATGLNNGVYHHYVYQRRKTSTGPDVWKLQLYIDGALDGEVTLPSVIDVSSGQTFYVASLATKSTPLSVTLDELAIFKGKSLTAEEIAALAAARTNTY